MDPIAGVIWVSQWASVSDALSQAWPLPTRWAQSSCQFVDGPGALLWVQTLSPEREVNVRLESTPRATFSQLITLTIVGPIKMNQFIFHISLLHVQEAESLNLKICSLFFFLEMRSWWTIEALLMFCLPWYSVFEKRKPVYPVGLSLMSLLTLTATQPPV